MEQREEEKKYGKIGNTRQSIQVLEHLLQQRDFSSGGCWRRLGEDATDDEPANCALHETSLHVELPNIVVRLSERRHRLGALLRHDKAEVGHSDGERMGAGRGDWERAGTKWEAWEVLGVCRRRNATDNTCTHLTRVIGCRKSAGLTSRSVVAPLNQTTSTWGAKAKQGVYRLAVMWQ